jgi:fused signal recognition particle receptor
MFENVKRGMSDTRRKFAERMNVLLDRGPDVDGEFWDGLEEALILSDAGAGVAQDIVSRMRDEATRKALPDAYAVMDALAGHIAGSFAVVEGNLFDQDPVLVLFVGINGAGKTTTVGKIAAESKAKGRNVILGSADTFRAAAVEQLEEWAHRADVEVVERERGSDPASVCYDTIERAEAVGSDLVLIDTAGRLHTSDDLMRELQKVVGVVRKRSKMPVKTVLVMDATTGQNGLAQAREFDRTLDLDGLIVTKLDGTAKGGIALAVSHELGLPIVKIGVGERLEDLQDFDACEFAAALIGADSDETGGSSDDRDDSDPVESSDAAVPYSASEPESKSGSDCEPASNSERASSGPDSVSAAASSESMDESGPSAVPSDTATPDSSESAGRFKRMFKRRGRKDV